MTSRRLTSILAGAILLVSAAMAVYFSSRTRPDPVDEKDRTVKIEPAIKIEPVSYKPPLVISVQAFYPGANAQIVADTVGAPIEQQVNDVEHALAMDSQSANDGSYVLHVTFEAGTDLDLAQVLVQNRVSLATPVLPAVVQNRGITVRKKSSDPLVLVSLTSSDNRFDSLYFSNYATIHVKDELARLPGVGDVVFFGQRDHRLCATLDLDKLATYQLSAMDVVAAISQQNVQVAAGQIGQPPVPKGQQFQLTIDTLGRLTNPQEFGNIILKASAGGPEGGVPGEPRPGKVEAAGIVRLKDVAHIKLGSSEGSYATLNGKPAVLLSIHPLPNAKPGDVSRAVLDKLGELRASAPDGLALGVAFDFAPNLEEANNPATPEHLVIDAQLPDGASIERTAQTLERAVELVRKASGVQDVLTLTEHPFSLVRNRPCLVVRLTPRDQRELGREQIARQVRVALHNEITEAVFRLSLPSTAEGFPVYGFPIEFAMEDRGDHGNTILRERADALVEKMTQSGKFLDVGVGPGLRSTPILTVDVDRTKCMTLGVDVNEIFNTMQVYFGSYYVNDFNQFGRTWQVNVQVEPRFRDRTSDILNLLVKNKQNQLLRLGKVMSVRDAMGPMVVERHNLYPIARITANLAEGVPLAEAKPLCGTLSEQEFGTKQFKLIWRTR